MPTRSFTLSVGSRREATVEGAGAALAGAPAVQVIIDWATDTREHDVLATLDNIKNQIISGRFPPA